MDKIYLIQFNDGMMHTASDIQASVFQAADEGELDIIDITDPTLPTLYANGLWRNIELNSATEMHDRIHSQLNN